MTAPVGDQGSPPLAQQGKDQPLESSARKLSRLQFCLSYVMAVILPVLDCTAYLDKEGRLPCHDQVHHIVFSAGEID